MDEKEKPKELEYQGKKVRFYYQDINAYHDDFLRAIIWYQQELIEKLGKKLNDTSLEESEPNGK